MHGSRLVAIASVLCVSVASATQDALRLRNDMATIGYVRIADSPSLEPQTFTLECWIQPDGIGFGHTTDTFGATLVTKPQEGATGSYISSWWLGRRATDGRIVGYVAHVFPTSGTSVTGVTPVLPGQIAHVALTFDGTHLRLYVNGALDGTVATNGASIAYGAEDVLIGAANYCCNYWRRYDGAIDEVRLWDHARDGLTIAAEAYCTFGGGTPPGLLARWNFDGATFLDSAGGGHDGVAEGTGVAFTQALFQPTSVCGPIGNRYCNPGATNSTGQSGRLHSFGSPLVANDSLILVAEGLPVGSFGFFLASQTQGFVMNPGGSQGNLCLSGQIGRFVGAGQVRNTTLGGTFALRTLLGAMPTPTGLVQVLAGQTWSYQAWHRDSVGGTATSNFTDALSIPYL